MLINHFKTFGHIDCLEEAILHYHAALRLCPQGHPRHQLSLEGPINAMDLLYLWIDRIEDLEESITLKHENLALTLPGDPMHPQVLYNLSVSL